MTITELHPPDDGPDRPSPTPEPSPAPGSAPDAGTAAAPDDVRSRARQGEQYARGAASHQQARADAARTLKRLRPQRDAARAHLQAWAAECISLQRAHDVLVEAHSKLAPAYHKTSLLLRFGFYTVMPGVEYVTVKALVGSANIAGAGELVPGITTVLVFLPSLYVYASLSARPTHPGDAAGDPFKTALVRRFLTGITALAVAAIACGVATLAGLGIVTDIDQPTWLAFGISSLFFGAVVGTATASAAFTAYSFDADASAYRRSHAGLEKSAHKLAAGPRAVRRARRTNARLTGRMDGVRLVALARGPLGDLQGHIGASRVAVQDGHDPAAAGEHAVRAGQREVNDLNQELADSVDLDWTPSTNGRQAAQEPS